MPTTTRALRPRTTASAFHLLMEPRTVTRRWTAWNKEEGKGEGI